MALTFTKAVKSASRLRICLSGASGSGKTYSALTLATNIGKKVAVIDTESGSAQLYADKFDFDVLELPAPYSPDRFIQCIKGAEQLGYDVIVIDSITHEWSGPGGCLDMQQKLGGQYQNWSKVTPQHDAFINAMITSKAHIITTMRSKTAYDMNNESGKTKVVKQGTAPVQRDGIEYEFTCVFDLNANHLASASKDRTGIFDGKDFVPDSDTAKQLVNWLTLPNGAEKDKARYQQSKEAITSQNEIDQAVETMEGQG